jgi:phosphatidylinositol alpha-1,6-mannosyltransferase
VTLIPNAVDTERFQPAPTPALTNGSPRVLCAGRLIERKGQHHLIEAVSQLRGMGQNGFKVLLAGTGDGEAALKAQVAREGLDDVVRFLGYVPWQEMPALYAAVDLFVLPSYNEGMSVALLEAMASGLPVVVTPTGGTEELMDGNGLLVPWADPAALAGALARLLSSPETRATMGGRSRELALQRTWPATAQAYLDLCQSAAQRVAA